MDFGAGEVRVNTEGCRVSLQGDEHVLKSASVLAAQLCEYTKNHQISQFEKENCVVYELYPVKLLKITKQTKNH